ESREKIFNDDNIQIAEFDVVIKGNLGSRPIQSLIECRDRPGGGAASGSWIEQLVGRKVVHGFDAVMAVSTTGFSPAAVYAAQRGDVELRLVEDLTAEDIINWLDLSNSTVFAQSVLVNATVHPFTLEDQSRLEKDSVIRFSR